MQKCTFRVGETAVLRKRSHETPKHATAKIYFSRRASANFSHSNCFGTGEAKNQPRCKRHRPKILKIVVSCKRNACFCSSAGVRFAAVDPKEELRIAISHCKTWDIVHACFPQVSRSALTSRSAARGARHFVRFVKAKRRFSSSKKFRVWAYYEITISIGNGRFAYTKRSFPERLRESSAQQS